MTGWVGGQGAVCQGIESAARSYNPLFWRGPRPVARMGHINTEQGAVAPCVLMMPLAAGLKPFVLNITTLIRYRCPLWAGHNPELECREAYPTAWLVHNGYSRAVEPQGVTTPCSTDGSVVRQAARRRTRPICPLRSRRGFCRRAPAAPSMKDTGRCPSPFSP